MLLGSHCVHRVYIFSSEMIDDGFGNTPPGAISRFALHASDHARIINNSLTYSLKGCILYFGLLRRGLSEDLFEACSKSRSFFNSPLFRAVPFLFPHETPS